MKRKAQTRLGVLDFGDFSPGSSPALRLKQTIAVAQLAEDLGYSRFWLAENQKSHIAWGAPEIMVGEIARATKKIRVGTAGIKLGLLPPYRTALIFRLYETLFPGRIDLGLVRETSSSSLLFTSQVEELMSHLSSLPKSPSQPFVNPESNAILSNPDIWIMGSTTHKSLTVAEQLGTSRCLSLFEKGNSERPEPVSTKRVLNKQFAIAVAGSCSEDEEVTWKAAFGQPNSRRLRVVGAPQQCAKILSNLQRRYNPDEIIFTDVSPDFESKMTSLKLLAQAVHE